MTWIRIRIRIKIKLDPKHCFSLIIKPDLKAKILDILVSGGDRKLPAQNILEAIQYSTRNWTKNV